MPRTRAKLVQVLKSGRFTHMRFKMGLCTHNRVFVPNCISHQIHERTILDITSYDETEKFNYFQSTCLQGFEGGPMDATEQDMFSCDRLVPVYWREMYGE